jgi:anti-sigma B factor antagonist
LWWLTYVTVFALYLARDGLLIYRCTMSQPGAGIEPQFKVEVDVQSDVTVVRCSGRLMIESGNTLRTEVEKLIKPGGRIVLDLTNVTHCDSMGLGSVISLYVSSKKAGCRLELINLGQKIRQLFSMANLLSLFEAAADSSCRIP